MSQKSVICTKQFAGWRMFGFLENFVGDLRPREGPPGIGFVIKQYLLFYVKAIRKLLVHNKNYDFSNKSGFMALYVFKAGIFEVISFSHF